MFSGFQQYYSSSETFSEDQVCKNTGYKHMFRTWLWLFSPAWDAVELTLQVGIICGPHFDPTNLGVTIVVAQA